MNLRLKEARERKGLLQNELADLIHVSRQAYSLYEKGDRHPSWDTVIVLVKVLGVSADYLLGLTDDPSPARPLDPTEQAVVDAYKLLDERGRSTVDITLNEQVRYSIRGREEAQSS